MNLARHEGLASASMPGCGGTPARMWGYRGHSAGGLKWTLTTGAAGPLHLFSPQLLSLLS